MDQSLGRPSVYTKAWLGNRTLIIGVLSIVFAMFAIGIRSLAANRSAMGLLSNLSADRIAESAGYCFVLEAVTMFSLVLVEIAFRKSITTIQYGLISGALFVFYLLLTSFAELVPFWCAYAIVTVMTVGLISVFINGITHDQKAVRLTSLILLVEYGFILVLLYLGTLALLIGSLCLFGLIAVAMYFTLKLKYENNEFTLKM